MLEIKRQLVYTLGSFFAFNPKPATFGLRSLKPVAVVERQADTYTTLLVGTDHLGSIVGLLSNNGRLVQKLSYDACSVSVGFYIKVKPATRTNPPPGGGQPPQPCQLQPALY